MVEIERDASAVLLVVEEDVGIKWQEVAEEESLIFRTRLMPRPRAIQ